MGIMNESHLNNVIPKNEIVTIEYGTGMVEASSREMFLGIVHDKTGSAVISLTVGMNGATPITIDPLDVKPEYSIGPSSYSTLLYFVSILVS